MRPAIREAVAAERPDWVLVYGDTNSTLGGARGRGRGGVPSRTSRRGCAASTSTMPEERNRIEVDRLAALLLCPGRALGARSSSRRGRGAASRSSAT